MSEQGLNYAADPELVVWDIACNLAAERCAEEYLNLSASSCLNPGDLRRRFAQLLDKLSDQIDNNIVCGVQEFPEDGTAKHHMLMDELSYRQLQTIKPAVKDSSVAFLVSNTVSVRRIVHSPLGSELKLILERIGGPALEEVDKRDQESLKTTAFKTLVMDVAGGLRFVNAHCKEFKTDAGLTLLSRYLKALTQIDVLPETEAALVLCDANTPNEQMSAKFQEAMEQSGFKAMTPAIAFNTTKKQRSEMHGQIYDNQKCLKVVEVHKDFIFIIHNVVDTWKPSGLACSFPDLKVDPRTLPNEDWPTDHCMLKAEIKR